MILWIAFFIIVIFISLILAALSMRNYQSPQKILKPETGLYLIRKTSQITPDFINSLKNYLGFDLISFERLVKGGESALVIFGPKDLLKNFYTDLDLLEIEDYISGDLKNLSVWEFSLKGEFRFNLFENFPHFDNNEQFFLQTVLGINDGIFKGRIRACLFSENSKSHNKLLKSLQNLSPNNLIKLPQTGTNKQILDSYKERNLGLNETQLSLDSSQILNLIKIR